LNELELTTTSFPFHETDNMLCLGMVNSMYP